MLLAAGKLASEELGSFRLVFVFQSITKVPAARQLASSRQTARGDRAGSTDTEVIAEACRRASSTSDYGNMHRPRRSQAAPCSR